MCLNGTNNTSDSIEQNNKEIENFLFEQQKNQQQPVNTDPTKRSTSTQNNQLPYIIQNGNIYQLTSSSSGSTNQLNSSNLIQISSEHLRSNSVKLTTIKNNNFINLNQNQNQNRIIIKANQTEIAASTISPSQKLQFTPQGQNEIKTINLFPQSSNSNQKILITNNNQPQTQTQNGSSIIVLTPSNRTINEQNLQFLIQQRNQNNTNAQLTASSLVQKKVYLPPTNCVNLVKKSQITTSIANTQQNGPDQHKTDLNPKSHYETNSNNDLNLNTKSLQLNNSNANLISLLNSNSNTIKIQPTIDPIQQNNKSILSNQKPTSNKPNLTRIASSSPSTKQTSNIQVQHLQQPITPFSLTEQNTLINEAILNDCILPDTRIFASLLNKDQTLPNTSISANSSQKNDIKFKTVMIGNTEHVILDNLQNLSDFKGNFSDLKNLACTVADHLNKSVTIPAFLLIESKPTVDKIESILNGLNINPIIIDTCASTQSSSTTTPRNPESKPVIAESNINREKFNQQHQNLIKKLSSHEPEQAKIVVAPSNTITDNTIKKKVSTPKRKAPKPKKTQLAASSGGHAQTNKSKLTINDLIQQNALNVSQEIEKLSNEPMAKKIKTINQMCSQTSVEQVHQVQSSSSAGAVIKCEGKQDQVQKNVNMQNNDGLANTDWLDQQIQIASEFIDTLYQNVSTDPSPPPPQPPENGNTQNLVKIEGEENGKRGVKNEPVLAHEQLVNSKNNSGQSVNQISSKNEYNFDLDPFDTNLFFTTNLNDIEF